MRVNILLSLILVSSTAGAQEWVSVWTPPAYASGGMESSVDVSSIRAIAPNMRAAVWRMVPWSRVSGPPPKLEGSAVTQVILAATFDCAKEIMRDDQTTMYMANGENNAGAIAPGNWSKPAGATRAVLDSVCNYQLK